MKEYHSVGAIKIFNSNIILSLSKDDSISYVLSQKPSFMFIIIFLLSINSFLFAQQNWFPKELNVQPFTANFLEPKAGFLFNTSDNKIRLDVGTSQDILHIKSQDDIFSFGADLFTFTRLRGEDDFHFPVETIDYLFGLNASFKKVLAENEYGIRFRFSHISAHLVDGQFDKAISQWRDGRLPQVYSREFLELFPFIRLDDLRFYAGLTYIFHSSPKEIKKGIFQIGGDYFITELSNQVFTPFIAYDFKLSGKEKYVGNNFINFGIKFGEFNKKGFSIYYSYISGKSVHGEYFDLNENYSSIGFNLDL
ncbi:MAG: DUF1207 domain-containing protein [Ignavibacterium sp.]|jgi:hypothetical protein|uniref:DUF1207 domain-containing protein n=1 Tax=Ignavibacterium sp. TaxID=2651167 RepID=UPI0032974FED